MSPEAAAILGTWLLACVATGSKRVTSFGMFLAWGVAIVTTVVLIY